MQWEDVGGALGKGHRQTGTVQELTPNGAEGQARQRGWPRVRGGCVGNLPRPGMPTRKVWRGTERVQKHMTKGTVTG